MSFEESSLYQALQKEAATVQGVKDALGSAATDAALRSAKTGETYIHVAAKACESHALKIGLLVARPLS